METQLRVALPIYTCRATARIMLSLSARCRLGISHKAEKPAFPQFRVPREPYHSRCSEKLKGGEPGGHVETERITVCAFCNDGACRETVGFTPLVCCQDEGLWYHIADFPSCSLRDMAYGTGEALYAATHDKLAMPRGRRSLLFWCSCALRSVENDRELPWDSSSNTAVSDNK